MSTDDHVWVICQPLEIMQKSLQVSAYCGMFKYAEPSMIRGGSIRKVVSAPPELTSLNIMKGTREAQAVCVWVALYCIPACSGCCLDANAHLGMECHVLLHHMQLLYHLLQQLWLC